MTTKSDGTRCPTTRSYPFFLLLLIVSVFTFWFFLLGDGLSFFRDEWDILLYRTPDDWVGALLLGHGGQQVPLITLMFLGGVEIVGLNHYEVFRAATVPIVGCLSILFYLLVTPRLGPWLALLPSLIILTLGSSYESALWPMVSLTFAGVCCLGIAALILCSRRSRGADLAATGALLAAMLLSGFALVLLTGVFVFLVLSRPFSWARLLIPVPALVLYLVWYFTWSPGSANPPESEIDYVLFPARMIEFALEGLTGASQLFLFSIGLLLMLVLIISRGRLRIDAPLFFSALAMLFCFSLLTSYTRGGYGGPGQIRYVLPIVLFFLLALSSLIDVRVKRNPALVAFMIGLAVLVIPQGIIEYSRGADHLKMQSLRMRAELAAVEVGGRDTIRPETSLELSAYGFPFSYHYFDLIDRFYSSPALLFPQFLKASNQIRLSADLLLLKAQTVLVPVPEAEADALRRGSRCSRFSGRSEHMFPLAFDEEILISAPGGQQQVRLRRFADSFVTLPEVRTRSFLLSPKYDREPSFPWRIQLNSRKGMVTVCRLADAS